MPAHSRSSQTDLYRRVREKMGLSTGQMTARFGVAWGKMECHTIKVSPRVHNFVRHLESHLDLVLSQRPKPDWML